MIRESAWWANLRRFGIKPGLGRTEALLRLLDHPERRFRAIHVGGTNGKGSTVALVSAGLRASGLKVGRYTSPDLGDVRERITIDGAWLSEARFCALAQRVEEAGRALPESPTRFEALTALSFLAFAEARVDVAVIEVGLGGRYDATNVLRAPLAVVFGPIALDHTAILGPTVAAIAEDKAGIIKTGVPVISVVQSPPARDAIVRAARAAGSAIHWARGRLIATTRRSVSAEVGGVSLTAALAGPHQARNLALAWTVLQVLKPALGLDLEAVQRGFLEVRWPGRLEWMAGSPPVLLDAAHNLHGTHALHHALQGDVYPAHRHLLFGVLDDKPGAAMLRTILPDVASVTLVRPESSRAGDPARWLSRLRGRIPVSIEGTLKDGLRAATARALKDDEEGMVLVMGSFDVVGPVREMLRQTAAPSDTR